VEWLIFIKLVAIFMIRNTSIEKGQPPPEQAADFQKAEGELLRENLRRSYKERFLMATTLYKIQQTMKRAVITHKPFVSK
jgi:hypothetical protein